MNLWRADFPILNEKINGNDLIYFDNAASSQKPKIVIDAINDFYTKKNANVHRGIHHLSEESTSLYESTRTKVQEFLNARNAKEIIFTSGTTHSLNLAALSLENMLKKDDEIIISVLEHHSNIVPWQMICKRKQCKLKIVYLNEQGTFNLAEFKSLLSEKTKIVSICYANNTLGLINPIEEIINLAKEYKAISIVDAAQAVLHFKLDVQKLDCDLLAFSAHKMLGATGVGVLYGKEEILNKMSPVFGGGDMIDKVSFEETTYNEIPYKFEAGTPNIAGVISFAKAIDYLNNNNLEEMHQYEQELLKYLQEQLNAINEVTIIGSQVNKLAIASFVVDGIHPHDIASFLNQDGIAVRIGHHCTQPLLKYLKVSSTTRASLLFYNTKEEINIFIESLRKTIALLK